MSDIPRISSVERVSKRIWPCWLPFFGFTDFLVTFEDGQEHVVSMFVVDWLGRGTAYGSLEIEVDSTQDEEQER